MQTQTLIRCLQASCIATALVGLAAAAASYGPTAEPWRLLFDVLSWPLDGHPSAFTTESASLNAVVGGLMVGWAALMFAVISGPIARGDKGMIHAMLVGVSAWFLVDSAGSVAAGLPGNVVLNVGFLLMFTVPLWVLRGR